MWKPLVFLSGLILFSLGLAGVAGQSAQQTAPAGEPKPNIQNPVTPTPASQARAKEIYGYDCGMCHGKTGDGKTDLASDSNLPVPDLSVAATLAGTSDQELYDAIWNGKGKMPADGPRLKTNEAWNLVIYVRQLSTKKAADENKAPAQ
jgi:mono/diheme cytochrome c family protein